jgi:arylsulfatase A-like enzyme
MTQVLRIQDSDSPFFYYVAPANAHSPLTELPDYMFSDYQLTQLEAVDGESRKMYARSVMALDNMVRDLVEWLRGANLLDDTYIFYR